MKLAWMGLGKERQVSYVPLPITEIGSDIVIGLNCHPVHTFLPFQYLIYQFTNYYKFFFLTYHIQQHVELFTFHQFMTTKCRVIITLKVESESIYGECHYNPNKKHLIKEMTQIMHRHTSRWSRFRTSWITHPPVFLTYSRLIVSRSFKVILRISLLSLHTGLCKSAWGINSSCKNWVRNFVRMQIYTINMRVFVSISNRAWRHKMMKT